VTTVVEAHAEGRGTVIGPYKLMEQIGEGGMGLVFVAEQQHPVRRKVALKVIKPGMDTRQVVARFEAERQALALMDHPNIAQVHDGGETSTGRPYFVMELVKGVPITAYCDQNQAPVRDRLELFVDVCQAVQHAHQKGIIHRDLKPSNVLVMSNDGRPLVKVIDFGVAKAIGQQLTEKTIYTQAAQPIGTPLYMSPEQAGKSGLDVDTRSDIYALGVLLYELLTGTTPFDKERLRGADFDEIRRIIREEEPPKPSTRLSTLGQAATTISTQRNCDPKRLSQLVRGELDWIVMKALEKDRNRRYDTASAFAADVQHYLADEPVLAGPPSTTYRLRKFLRRNRVALTVSLLVLALCGAAVGSALRVRQVEREAVAELAAGKEMAENMRRTNEWVKYQARFMQINDWLTDSPNGHPTRGPDRVLLNPHDRQRLRRAMLEEVLTEVDKAEPLSLDPELTLALLIEVAIRETAAYRHAEIDRPAQGIPHLERVVVIENYLGSPASGLPAEAKRRWPRVVARARVWLLDLRERAGAVESMETDLVEAEHLLAGMGEKKGEPNALAGIRGALLGRRGDFAAGERLLLGRHAALTQADNPAMEYLPGERVATARRLVNLYTAWGRPDEAAKWPTEQEAIRVPESAPEPPAK
jgi:serine/threonine protein kinase